MRKKEKEEFQVNLAKGALINSCLSANRQECFVKSYSERDLNPHNRYGHKISTIRADLERKTRLELATLTLARLCSTN